MHFRLRTQIGMLYDLQNLTCCTSRDVYVVVMLDVHEWAPDDHGYVMDLRTWWRRMLACASQQFIQLWCIRHSCTTGMTTTYMSSGVQWINCHQVKLALHLLVTTRPVSWPWTVSCLGTDLCKSRNWTKLSATNNKQLILNVYASLWCQLDDERKTGHTG